jgi:uncharacterized protein (TIGR02996 family)
MRTFTYSDAKSHKFWNIELKGNSFTVTYGRQGAAGQTQTKQFPDEEKARKEHDKLVQEKLAKGYAETTPQTASPATPMRAALEQALAAHPDDLASHMAYADYLQEQGDPRGEFIQVQLALEDAGKPAAQRKKLQKRERELLGAHARAWLGEFAPYLLDQKKEREGGYEEPEYKYQFTRGWLDSVEARNYQSPFTRALARAPQARLLRRLILQEDAYEERGESEGTADLPADAYPLALYVLLRSPNLANVRVLQIGDSVDDTERGFNCHMSGGLAVALVKEMPRLEELYLFAQGVDTDQLFGLKTLHHLRVLQVYHMNNYPLAKLAKNPSLGRLTHLLCHPHCMVEDEPYIRLAGLRAVVRSTTLASLTHLRLRLSDFGDKGCAEIVNSGVLKRLQMLDLRGGCVTDEGARTLAACPDLRHLEWLDLERNCLTEAGTAALAATGVRFTAKDPWAPSGDEYRDRQYLYEGDGE